MLKSIKEFFCRLFCKQAKKQNEIAIALQGNEYSHWNESFFTQAELQQLKEHLSRTIRETEDQIQLCLSDARYSKHVGMKDHATEWYNAANKLRKTRNSLARLQSKIKHSIITLG